ncbi:MAG TPA: GNAT family N-acetyltransferase [Candidatus Bathyarchaeia archaeon]|nr:GNAT family N-acetyltransferase [Candidatus Bathyarchaeia archaeon]
MAANWRCVVREAQQGHDEVQIARILSECFGSVTPRQLSEWMSKPEVKTFVCEVEDEVVSHINVVFKELHLGEGGYSKTGGIGGVCTCSEFRRKGLMTSMMRQTLDYLKNAGISNSALYTGLMLPAHRIYERSGFCDVTTLSSYVKILDFAYVFRLWLRDINRDLKVSRIAQKTLQGWNRTIVIHFEEFGVQSFRFSHGRFRRIHKPPRNADIVMAASLETLFRATQGELRFEELAKTGKIQIKRGTEADVQMLRRILTRVWDE